MQDEHAVTIDECPCDAEALAVLACCVYEPSLARLAAIAKRYNNDCNLRMLKCRSGGRLAGIAGVDLGKRESAVLLHLAVDQDMRGQGIGRKLIEALMKRYALTSLEAETDGDAVGFYRNCGFSIIDLGEKYPGVKRYRCIRTIELK